HVIPKQDRSSEFCFAEGRAGGKPKMTAAGKDRMKLLNPTTHYLLAIAVSVFGLASIGFTQIPPPTAKPPEVKTKIKPPKFPMKGELPPRVEMGSGTTSERSIQVDPKVNLSLCVTQGTVSVNGWSRNEVRAFVKDGSRFEFKV